MTPAGASRCRLSQPFRGAISRPSSLARRCFSPRPRSRRFLSPVPARAGQTIVNQTVPSVTNPVGQSTTSIIIINSTVTGAVVNAGTITPGSARWWLRDQRRRQHDRGWDHQYECDQCERNRERRRHRRVRRGDHGWYLKLWHHHGERAERNRRGRQTSLPMALKLRTRPPSPAGSGTRARSSRTSRTWCLVRLRLSLASKLRNQSTVSGGVVNARTIIIERASDIRSAIAVRGASTVSGGIMNTGDGECERGEVRAHCRHKQQRLRRRLEFGSDQRQLDIRRRHFRRGPRQHETRVPQR